MPNGDRDLDRRSVLKAIGSGTAATAVGLGTTGSATADHDGEHFTNPTYPDRVFADPTLVRVDGTYYAYASNMAMQPESAEELIPIAASDDLVEWTFVGEAMAEKPDWRDDDASLWAPEVAYYDGEYRIYYSYSTWGSQDNPGIGLATADSPEGPFVDQGPVFREEDLGMTNCIDAEFQVVDGTPYLVWGSWYGIWGVELTADGTDYVPGTEFQLAGDHKEAPWMIERNGYWYLFYSTGYCCEGYDSDYAVEVGRSDSFFGPYYNQNGDDLRDLNEHHSGVSVLSGTDRFPGPGHNGGVRDDNGDWWMLYHAYDTQEPEYRNDTWNRIMFTDRIQWTDDGWPVVGCDGSPSLESPLPHSGETHCDPGSGSGGDIADGTYRITNVNSGLSLEVADASTEDGATVQQWSDTGHATQEWIVRHQGGGEYTLENANSGQLMEVEGASTDEGADVRQWPSSDHATQRWYVVDNADGSYRLENVNSGHVADVEGAATDDGANVIQWGWLDNANQKWRFDPV